MAGVASVIPKSQMSYTLKCNLKPLKRISSPSGEKQMINYLSTDDEINAWH